MSETPKVAFCIECHKYTAVLQYLVDYLSGEGAEIFVHVDARRSLAPFAPLTGKVRFVAPRSRVYWGGVGQIECMLTLFAAAHRGGCGYTVLLSGDALPVRPREEMMRFMTSAATRHEQYIEMLDTLDIAEIRNKLQRMHYFDKTSVRRRLAHICAKLLLPRRNHWFVTLPPIEKGANWVAFSRQFGDFMFDYLASHPDYVRAYSHSLCGDELFFQTLVGVSGLHNTPRSVMYADFSRGGAHPSMLATADVRRLVDGSVSLPAECMFARKVRDDVRLEEIYE